MLDPTRKLLSLRFLDGGFADLLSSNGYHYRWRGRYTDIEFRRGAYHLRAPARLKWLSTYGTLEWCDIYARHHWSGIITYATYWRDTSHDERGEALAGAYAATQQTPYNSTTGQALVKYYPEAALAPHEESS